MPEATEETGHVWLHDGEQSVNLNAEVAMLVEGYQWDSVYAESEAENIAKAILNIPQLRKALDLYSRTVTPEAEIEGRKAF
jgi:hypothetical protein